MGCCSSKDDLDYAAAAERKDQKAGVSKGNSIGKATEQVHSVFKDILGLPNVIDHVTNVAMLASAQVRTNAHHLRNVFAAPLEHIGTFVPPTFPKSREEQDFIANALAQNFVFSNLSPKELQTMVDAFARYTVPDVRSTIIHQGEPGDYFYILERGAVQFEVNGKMVGKATAGQSFGELALLYAAPRAASVITQTPNCELFRVDQKTFRYILQYQTKETERTKRELLQNISFLKELDMEDLNKLVGTMTPRPFEEGEYLVKKGDPGDAFYVIQEGTVNVTDITIGMATYQDQTLGPGEYFGERALVTHEPRAANCIGATKGIALCVDSETFHKVMGNLSHLLLQATDKRKLSAIKTIAETYLLPTDLASLAELIVEQSYKASMLIIEEGMETEAALYLVRTGTVQITSRDGKHHEVVEADGYFGEDFLLLDRNNDEKGSVGSTRMAAGYTVKVVSEECTLGVLTLKECRTVMDTTVLGKGVKTEVAPVQDTNIRLEDLTRHAILGAGTFGQVWLVSKQDTGGDRRPYALKIQSKFELIQNSQAKGVVQEKNIMARLNHPFIIKLVNTYQDEQRVYMLLGLVQGGELFSVLHQPTRDGVPEKSAKFYAAGVIEGLSYMHHRHILYRDLKPENVLVDAEGYTVIVDLGFAKYVKEKTYTLCGTPLYIAPEVVLNRGHDKGADHWSFGVLVYEMITGYTPFYKEGMDQITLFRQLCRGKFDFPPLAMSTEVKDLIARLLVVDPTRRIGSLARGSKDIYRHEWFSDLSFEKLRKKEISAPWLPKIKDPLDSSNFEDWGHLADKGKTKDPPLSEKQNAIFKSF